MPFDQVGYGGVIFVATANSGARGARVAAATLLPAMRAAMERVDPGQSTYATRTLDGLVGDTLAQRRASLYLLAVFSAVALVITSYSIHYTKLYDGALF